ncbi:hypothetical protein quinque_010930 [Culex quinquefasciatus]
MPKNAAPKSPSQRSQVTVDGISATCAKKLHHQHRSDRGLLEFERRPAPRTSPARRVRAATIAGDGNKGRRHDGHHPGHSKATTIVFPAKHFEKQTPS